VRITTIGRGNVGGGLGDLWRRAGHEVVEMGREGGDASGSGAVLLAVPQTAIPDALASVNGLEGVPVIDAVNAVRGPRPEGFESLAEYVKSLTGGPVAKAFNANFATLYDRIGKTSATPRNGRTPPSYVTPGTIRVATQSAAALTSSRMTNGMPLIRSSVSLTSVLLHI